MYVFQSRFILHCSGRLFANAIAEVVACRRSALRLIPYANLSGGWKKSDAYSRDLTDDEEIIFILIFVRILKSYILYSLYQKSVEWFSQIVPFLSDYQRLW